MKTLKFSLRYMFIIFYILCVSQSTYVERKFLSSLKIFFSTNEDCFNRTHFVRLVAYAMLQNNKHIF